jgi:hypothetical protein
MVHDFDQAQPGIVVGKHAPAKVLAINLLQGWDIGK